MRVTEYSCAQVPEVVASVNVNDGDESHASLALGEENEGVAGHSIVALAPTPEITGAVLSSTEIV